MKSSVPKKDHEYTENGEKDFHYDEPKNFQMRKKNKEETYGTWKGLTN